MQGVGDCSTTTVHNSQRASEQHFLEKCLSSRQPTVCHTVGSRVLYCRQGMHCTHYSAPYGRQVHVGLHYSTDGTCISAAYLVRFIRYVSYATVSTASLFLFYDTCGGQPTLVRYGTVRMASYLCALTFGIGHTRQRKGLRRFWENLRYLIYTDKGTIGTSDIKY